MGNIYDLRHDNTGSPDRDLGDFDDNPTPSCPICGGPSYYLGTLGHVEYARCRNCASTFSLGADDDPA